MDPLDGTTELAYDGAGNLLRSTDPTGIVTTLEYDDDHPGKVNERTRGEARISFRYDEYGDTTQIWAGEPTTEQPISTLICNEAGDVVCSGTGKAGC